jgi:hypothetical protein
MPCRCCVKKKDSQFIKKSTLLHRMPGSVERLLERVVWFNMVEAFRIEHVHVWWLQPTSLPRRTNSYGHEISSEKTHIREFKRSCACL